MIDKFSTLRYFSEDKEFIGAECPTCGRVLKVNKKDLEEVDGGLLLNHRISCLCGRQYAGIDFEESARNSLPSVSRGEAPSPDSSSHASVTKTTHSFKGVAVLVVALLVAVIWIGNRISSCDSSGPSSSRAQVSATSTTSNGARVLSAYEGEKNYISSANGYLQSLYKYDMQLGNVMAGASSGQSTLAEIKDEIERVKSIQDAAWYGDYQKYPPASPEQKAVGVKITECRRLHDSSFKEMLVYWKDGNVAHIQSGTLVFQRGIQLGNECIVELGNITKALTDKIQAINKQSQAI